MKNTRTAAIYFMVASLFFWACGSEQQGGNVSTPSPANTATLRTPTQTSTLTPIPSPTLIPSTPTLDKGIQDPESGHWYLVLNPMTWDVAVNSCASMGGTLAIIESASENDFVYNHVVEPKWGPEDILLGGTDKDREGRWVWANGETMKYTNWINGEPNNCGFFETYGKCIPENYLTYNPDHPGKWNDVPVSGKARYLCEFEA